MGKKELVRVVNLAESPNPRCGRLRLRVASKSSRPSSSRLLPAARSAPVSPDVRTDRRQAAAARRPVARFHRVAVVRTRAAANLTLPRALRDVSLCLNTVLNATGGGRGPGAPNRTYVDPQDRSVDPAPAAIQGLYVVSTNNKEDVVVTKVPWSSV